MSIPLIRMVEMNPQGIGYNEMAKADFKALGRNFLRALVRDTEIINHDIGYNAGGIAVSGDHSVMLKYRDGTCINLFFNMSHLGICYRKCKDFKDHSGQANNYIRWDDVKDPGNVQTILRGFVYGSGIRGGIREESVTDCGPR